MTRQAEYWIKKQTVLHIQYLNSHTMKTTFTKEQKKQYFAEKRAKYLEALATFKGKLADNFVCYNAFTGHVYSGITIALLPC